MNPEMADNLSIIEGERVRLSTRRGSIEITAHVTERIVPNVVFMPFHFTEAAANWLTQSDLLDPVAKIPEYKVSAARIEKL